RREHVSGGPAAPDHDLHRDALLAPAPAVPFAVAEPRAIAARTPIPASVTTSAEPPKETSGSGTPVIGSRPVTAPRLMIVCGPIHDTMPAASSRSNVPGAWIAMRIPAHSRTPNPI